MAWVAVEQNEAEVVFALRPYRRELVGEWTTEALNDIGVYLPSGSIRKLIGRELTWEDDPVELQPNTLDVE